jgi:prevent-host-death family protein
MKSINISEGQERFFELVEVAAGSEPIVFTSDGVELAVMITYDEYLRLSGPPPESLGDFFVK